MQPRLIRLRDAPRYLGMDRNRFNAEVRPYLINIKIGQQGIAFDRLDLDKWTDSYKQHKGLPAKRKMIWDANDCQGSIKRGAIWHINKRIRGQRISESTGTSYLEEAECYLMRRIEQIRQATIYGIRPNRNFCEAAIKFLKENQHKVSLATDARLLKQLDPFIGRLPLTAIHSVNLQHYIDSRKAAGVKNRTINYGLQVVRRILNLAAQEWRDEHGLTWLSMAPKIRLLKETNKRLPYPLDREEEICLFNQLPLHLRQMALFAVNTGCRRSRNLPAQMVLGNRCT